MPPGATLPIVEELVASQVSPGTHGCPWPGVQLLCPDPPPCFLPAPGEGSATTEAEPGATLHLVPMAPSPYPHPRGEILWRLASDRPASIHANSLEAAVIRRGAGESRGEESEGQAPGRNLLLLPAAGQATSKEFVSLL